jgi:hypothetical protein
MYGLTGSSYRRTPFRKLNSLLASAVPQYDSLGCVRRVGLMPKRWASSDNSAPITTGGSGGNGTTSTFWSNLKPGAFIDVNFAANTYNTVANVTGAGDICNIIGPTTTQAGVVIDVELTIDGGAPVVSSFTTPSANNMRLFIGPVNTWSTGQVFLGFGLSDSVNNQVIDLTSAKAAGNNAVLPPPIFIRAALRPRIRFDQSFLLRMRTSILINGTVNNERRAGVTYLLD